MKASSPTSTGPAGARFEGQVGAHYLLSLLTGAEPRGLPGAAIERVAFQKAAEGHPLDDIVVHARDGDGEPVALEIQVKRDLAFTHSEEGFQKVVEQIAEAARRPEFFDSRRRLAIAVSRGSRKIDGPVQDVLKWAREMGSAGPFMDRIDRPGAANRDMRAFVHTFRSNLENAGAKSDDETVWRLLSRLQVLVFDFTAEGSMAEAWERERAALALHPDDAARAGALRSCLVELAIDIASSGGDRDRERLIRDARDRDFRLAGARHTAAARARLAEDARHALADIEDRIAGAGLARTGHIAAIREALDRGRYVEIRGEAGVGKSGLLKHFAEEMAAESRIAVLAHGRVPPGGWAAMRTTLGFDGTAREFLVDLAASGGGALFIDGLDFLDERERLTVADLAREAPDIPGFAIIATARSGFDGEDGERNPLPADALDRLGRAEPIAVGELTDDEIAELKRASPVLAPLLADGHPARAVARNLFRLARLATRPGEGTAFRTEIDMAEDWWRTADGPREGRRERSRLLRALAEQALSGAGPLNASQHPAPAVDALMGSGTLRDLGGDRMAFRHDIFRDWAVANLLRDTPENLGRLPLDRLAPAALVRGVELAARAALERSLDGAAWRALLDNASGKGAHPSWRRAALLAPARSEIGERLLERVSDRLLADDGRLLSETIRTAMAVDVKSMRDFLIEKGRAAPDAAKDLELPGPSWRRLCRWLLSLGEDLPKPAWRDAADLFADWSIIERPFLGAFGDLALLPRMARWFFDRLSETDDIRWDELSAKLREGFLIACAGEPPLAGQYLRSLTDRTIYDPAVEQVLKSSSLIAPAAPTALAELTVAVLIDEDEPDHSGRAFGAVDSRFVPASPNHGPFFHLLEHAPEGGLDLIRRVVDYAVSVQGRGRSGDWGAITVSFPDGERAFSYPPCYPWSRRFNNAPSAVASALMALEVWGHRRIEAGEAVEGVLADVLPPPGGPAAYLLVAVDLLLSHWPKSREAAIPFLACPELLSLDLGRFFHDSIGMPDIFGLGALVREPAGPVGVDSLKARPSRRSTLKDRLEHYAIHAPREMRDRLGALLRAAAERLGPYGDGADLRDPRFMAFHALNTIDPSNWQRKTVALDDGRQVEGWEYVSPAGEEQHLAKRDGGSRPKVGRCEYDGKSSRSGGRPLPFLVRICRRRRGMGVGAAAVRRRLPRRQPDTETGDRRRRNGRDAGRRRPTLPSAWRLGARRVRGSVSGRGRFPASEIATQSGGDGVRRNRGLALAKRRAEGPPRPPRSRGQARQGGGARLPGYRAGPRRDRRAVAARYPAACSCGVHRPVPAAARPGRHVRVAAEEPSAPSSLGDQAGACLAGRRSAGAGLAGVSPATARYPP